MTELQVEINDLKEVIIAADLVLEKLKKANEDLKKSKVPSFPSRFIVMADSQIAGTFLIGLHSPTTWDGLPTNFRGRSCFDKQDIQQIIDGLQMLIGEEK